ncbi:TDT family transporter [Streptomyces sp. NPDC058872]|uniref:TDT family transporter n=1 Tax=Streptomyces sp. NPDC058872 TaxID=3346661 RepID=UPI0036BBBA52
MPLSDPPGVAPRETAARRLLGDLQHPHEAFRHLGPNWYASVMGTAIVANAGATLPVHVTGLRTFATAVWGLSLVMLLALLAARAVHFVRHPDQARAHLFDPTVAPFYGCPPMALLAVGAGTLLVGQDVIGADAALALSWTLWISGTALGLVVAVAVPFLMITAYELKLRSASTAWLLPIVAPMVSAATGPLLIPHLPAGQWREAMLLGCYAMFGLSLMATLLILPTVWSKLVQHKVGPLQMTPTLWLVLGPLGQSTTAVNSLGDVCCGAVDAQLASALRMFAIIYGVPVMGFAMMWMALSAAVTASALANRMPFALTWWGFTFPVGTCVTGASGLALHTGLSLYTWMAVALYVLLLAAWAVTATRTAIGAGRGALFLPPR